MCTLCSGCVDVDILITFLNFHSGNLLVDSFDFLLEQKDS